MTDLHSGDRVLIPLWCGRSSYAVATGVISSINVPGKYWVQVDGRSIVSLVREIDCVPMSKHVSKAQLEFLKRVVNFF